MNAIEIRGLKRRFGEKTAVDIDSLEIAQGEFFALLGVNGAGKTTTIRMLSCLLAPSEGTASVMGCDVSAQADRARAQTAVSPQETAVAGNLTVRENLEFIAGIHGFSASASRAKAEELAGSLGLTGEMNTRAKKLSGGMQRRLSIAMALIGDPKVIFLDEPTLGLDVLARRELWKVIASLKGKITVILTTHYLEEAQALADRVGIMVEGRLAAVGTVDEIVAAHGGGSLENAFVAIAEEAAK